MIMSWAVEHEIRPFFITIALVAPVVFKRFLMRLVQPLSIAVGIERAQRNPRRQRQRFNRLVEG